MTPMIIPSILSADLGRLLDQVNEAVEAGATRIEVDVMDGHFVPNISVGVPVVSALARATDVTLVAHLMIERPEEFLAAFADAGANVLTVHVEATPHLHRAIDRIHSLGLLAGAALNPATPTSALEEVLPDLDVALVMTVDPGFGGQSFIPTMLPKIRRLRDEIAAWGSRAEIQADGGIGVANARVVVEAGATQLVAGTGVFRAGVPIGEAFAQLRSAALSGSPTA